MTSGTEKMRVTTVEEADAVRFLKHEAEKRAVNAGAHGHGTQGPLGHGQAAPRNLMAAFNAA
jgi:hypothetical protein